MMSTSRIVANLITARVKDIATPLVTIGTIGGAYYGHEKGIYLSRQPENTNKHTVGLSTAGGAVGGYAATALAAAALGPIHLVSLAAVSTVGFYTNKFYQEEQARRAAEAVVETPKPGK